jgi:2-C-methyl-D-erythritol 2,4-cyclodiphosphate synthase
MLPVTMIDLRTGFGFDAHRLAAGRRLVLGGVEFPGDEGLLGHSDADVLTHAVMDALLGAAALGDIGQWFSDRDPRWKDADSLDLLRRVRDGLRERGWSIRHVDVTVLAERPRLAPRVPAMRERLAAALDVEPGRVSVKATTVEGMGALGRGEGIAAQAVATLCAPGGDGPGAGGAEQA